MFLVQMLQELKTTEGFTTKYDRMIIQDIRKQNHDNLIHNYFEELGQKAKILNSFFSRVTGKGNNDPSDNDDFQVTDNTIMKSLAYDIDDMEIKHLRRIVMRNELKISGLKFYRYQAEEIIKINYRSTFISLPAHANYEKDFFLFRQDSKSRKIQKRSLVLLRRQKNQGYFAKELCAGSQIIESICKAQTLSPKSQAHEHSGRAGYLSDSDKNSLFFGPYENSKSRIYEIRADLVPNAGVLQRPSIAQSQNLNYQPCSELEGDSVHSSDVYVRLANFHSNYDGAASDEENKVSYSKNQPKAKVTMGKATFDRFTGNKESENAWRQALGQRAGIEQINTPEERIRDNISKQRSEIVQSAPTKSAISAFSDLRRKNKKEAKQEMQMVASEVYRQKIIRRKAMQDESMNSWQAALEATESKAKAKSRQILKQNKPFEIDRRFPITWSSYSSHDQTERLTRKLSLEQIKVRDFAILGYKDQEIIWCLGHDAHGHKLVLDQTSQKNKFKQKVENSAVVFLYKIQVRDVQFQAARARGRRGSLSVAGEVEYPELELLPVSLMTDVEIANEVLEGERKLEKMKKIELQMMEKLKQEQENEEKILEADSGCYNILEFLRYEDVVDVMADVMVEAVFREASNSPNSIPEILITKK